MWKRSRWPLGRSSINHLWIQNCSIWWLYYLKDTDSWVVRWFSHIRAIYWCNITYFSTGVGCRPSGSCMKIMKNLLIFYFHFHQAYYNSRLIRNMLTNCRMHSYRWCTLSEPESLRRFIAQYITNVNCNPTMWKASINECNKKDSNKIGI